MSYILDALKKSEQERQKTASPTLQTIHRPMFADNRKSGAFRVVLLLCVVLSLALALTSWRYSWQEQTFESDASLTAQMSPPFDQPAPVMRRIETIQGQDRQSLPAKVEAGSPADSNFDVISPRQSAAMGEQPVVEFWELPDPVQKQIPALTFSFHVYSDNPERRTIIINNHRVREGDQVTDGLMLEEITVDGVVLGWQRFRFRINVVEQW